jgi:DNA-binding MarR family transcriptional regulator
MRNAPRLPTLEGANGVGKTSLVNVTAFRAFEQHVTHGTGPLLIPCNTAFQLKREQPADSFLKEVYPAIAQSLVSFRDLQNTFGEVSDTAARWLTAPAGDEVRRILNSGAAEGKFEALAERTLAWLREIFVDSQDGGVVCTIDNMELLQESEVARTTLEELRDTVLVTPGLRWVLCGAAGIVRSVVSSPRLEGHLHTPLEIREMPHEAAGEILPARVRAFAAAGRPQYLPLDGRDFESLYRLLRGNLRAALGQADSYCTHVAESGELPDSAEAKRGAFAAWFKDELAKVSAAIQDKLPPRTMRVFKRAVELGGSFSPGDFADFGFESNAALRPHVKSLEEVGVFASVREDADKRRKTITILPKGWLFEAALELANTESQ